jgi:hypothetical protein
VKEALNLQDLLRLAFLIYKIYLHTILLQLRMRELKSIYLLRGHHTKSVAESSYSLPSGEGFYHSNVPPPRQSAMLLLKRILGYYFFYMQRSSCTLGYTQLPQFPRVLPHRCSLFLKHQILSYISSPGSVPAWVFSSSPARPISGNILLCLL